MPSFIFVNICKGRGMINTDPTYRWVIMSYKWEDGWQQVTTGDWRVDVTTVSTAAESDNDITVSITQRHTDIHRHTRTHTHTQWMVG